jgi:ATP-dependent DNA ligase
MLAKTLDWTKVQYPCLVQPKLDGVRCMMIVDPDNSEIRFLSRSGKEYTTLGHVKDHVQDWLVNYPNVEDLKKFILDGEIYSDKLTFQEIVAAVKKQRPDSLKLGFRVYDTVDTDTIQMNRIIDKAGLVMSIDSEHITDVPSQLALKADDVKMFYALYMKDGYEGAMVRHVKGAYEQGQRSSDLLKLKEFDSTEFAFIQFEKGLRDEDLIALCETEKGLYFKAKMAGTVKEKKSFEEFEYALRNTAVTVKHFGYTDDGLPRFPVGISFRDYE